MNRRMVAVLLSLLFLLSLPACTAAGRTPEERISAVLETLYNCPEKYHREHYSELSDFETASSAMEAWMEYNKSRFYADDFEDGLLDKLVTGWTQNSVFPEILLLSSEAQLTVRSVEVEAAEKNGGLYHFTAAVTLKDRQNNEADYSVTGNARVNAEGKICEFRILDNKDLMLAVTPPPEAPSSQAGE